MKLQRHSVESGGCKWAQDSGARISEQAYCRMCPAIACLVQQPLQGRSWEMIWGNPQNIFIPVCVVAISSSLKWDQATLVVHDYDFA